MIAREPRHPLHASIILTARGFGRHFIVRNVSRSGAGIEGEKMLAVGERVTLNFRDSRVNGTVRWADRRKAGVAFERQLDDGVLHSLISGTHRPEMGLGSQVH